MKNYSIFLPVFKQGDDLAHFLNEQGTNGQQAFEKLAEQYKSASEMCICIANNILNKKIFVYANTHYIGISGSKKALKGLIENDLLIEEEHEDM